MAFLKFKIALLKPQYSVLQSNDDETTVYKVFKQLLSLNSYKSFHVFHFWFDSNCLSFWEKTASSFQQTNLHLNDKSKLLVSQAFIEEMEVAYMY